MHHGGDDPGAQPCGHEDGCDGACLTLKLALVSDGAALVIPAQFSQLYTLVPFILRLDTTTVGSFELLSRQALIRARVFTPELRLGPAFRSHAPPFFSLA